MNQAPATHQRSSRAPHLDPRLVGLVALGGALGATARATIGLAIPHSPGGWPWATLLVNLTGTFVLALVMELLGRWRRGHTQWRLFLGTGLLGGFTTYSAFMVEALELLVQARALTALAYVAFSVMGGLVAAWVGSRLVTR